MTRPRRKNLYLQERVLISHPHGQKTAPAFEAIFKPVSDFLVTKIRYVSESGLVADATNFFALSVRNNDTAAVLANWSTEVGEEGTISSESFADFVSTAASHVVAKDETLIFNFVEGGTATLPPGRLQIEGRYL